MNKHLVKVKYNAIEDAFDLLISTDGGKEWDLDTRCHCKRYEGQTPKEDPYFISCGIITKLNDAIELGYKMVYPEYNA